MSKNYYIQPKQLYITCYVHGEQEELKRFHNFILYCQSHPIEVRYEFETLGSPTMRDMLIHLGMKKREADNMQHNGMTGGIKRITWSLDDSYMMLIIATWRGRGSGAHDNHHLLIKPWYSTIQKYFNLEFIYGYYKRCGYGIVTNDINCVHYKINRNKYYFRAVDKNGKPIFDGLQSENFYHTYEKLTSVLEHIIGKKYKKRSYYYTALDCIIQEKLHCNKSGYSVYFSIDKAWALSVYGINKDPRHQQIYKELCEFGNGYYTIIDERDIIEC